MSPRTILIISVVMTLPVMLLLFVKHPRVPQQPYAFSREQAIRDTLRGRVRLMTFGMAGMCTSPGEVAIARKYGFVESEMGCVIGYTHGEREYDSIVGLYLDRRNGKNWWLRFRHSLDSLHETLTERAK